LFAIAIFTAANQFRNLYIKNGIQYIPIVVFTYLLNFITRTRRYKSAKVFLGEVVVRGMVDIPQAVNDMNGMLDDLEMMFLKDNKFLTG